MLPDLTVPAGLDEVLQACRGAFTAPTFCTFLTLVCGFLGATGRRTITGMWVAAGLAGRAHHARAHRFFPHARWCPDTVGLLLARAVIAAFVPAEAPITVVVDDTLFHRYGKKVAAAFWQHDGPARGRDGLGRGNCFVIFGVSCWVELIGRPVFLPAAVWPVPAQTESLQAGAGPGDRRHLRRRDPPAGGAPGRRRSLPVQAMAELPAAWSFTTGLAANASTPRRRRAPAGVDGPAPKTPSSAHPPNWPPPPPGQRPPSAATARPPPSNQPRSPACGTGRWASCPSRSC
jgi:hypothetical protein